MRTLYEPPGVADAVHARGVHPRSMRVRMAGRDDAALHVSDVVAPAIVRRGGWSAHAVCFAAVGDGCRESVVAYEPALVRAAPRRLAAYLAGRYCASLALDAAGWNGDVPVAIGDAGAPAWPAGAVGSISHAATRAVAIVGSAARWRGLGVDCEQVLAERDADEIMRSALPEADAVARDDAISWAEFVTVGFSAKESLYKCLRPLVGEFFDVDDARLTRLDRVARTVRLRLTRGLGGDDASATFGAGAVFDVAFAIADGHVYTCLALPAVDRWSRTGRVS